MRGSVPVLAQWVRIRCCHELWCTLQTQLGSLVAVAVVKASSCSSNWTPSLGTSICLQCSPKKTKDKEKGRREASQLRQKKLSKRKLSLKVYKNVKTQVCWFFSSCRKLWGMGIILIYKMTCLSRNFPLEKFASLSWSSIQATVMRFLEAIIH